MNLFEECVEEIRTFRTLNALPFGWRFLYVPRENLQHNNGLVILGLNPGGKEITETPDVKGGNAYIQERWHSRLQTKMLNLWLDIAEVRGWSEEYLRTLLNESVTGNVVPFISPTYDYFTAAQSAKLRLFAREMWAKIFKQIKPKAIIAVGSLSEGIILEALRLMSNDKNRAWLGQGYEANRQKVHVTWCDGARLIKIPHLAHWASFCDAPNLIQAIAHELKCFDVSTK